jgi:ubiquinone/menaquinone biosynthesis C-methylase UbiE
MTNTLPTGDRTPEEFALHSSQKDSKLKQMIRRITYPPILALRSPWLDRRFSNPEFSPDRWLLGQRGNDYDAHRRRVNAYQRVSNANILIAGCGTGNDIESWSKMGPRSVVASDWFCYERAWNLRHSYHSTFYPNVDLSFFQADLASMPFLESASIDIVSSDAVFEHLRNLPDVLAEFHRILRPRGIVYATFGPLWFGYGGDHVSGYDEILNGYNHLLLPTHEWHNYLSKMGEHSHSEHDGRTWISEDLFSKLSPIEYLTCLHEAGFKRRFVQAIIDPRALQCMMNQKLRSKLCSEYKEIDLLTSGMTVIYEKI